MRIEDLKEALMRGFAERRRDEIERGVTLVGPHREDITLLLGGMPVKHFASHGRAGLCAGTEIGVLVCAC